MEASEGKAGPPPRPRPLLRGRLVRSAAGSHGGHSHSPWDSESEDRMGTDGAQGVERVGD